MLTRTSAQEYAKSGIYMNAVDTGFVFQFLTFLMFLTFLTCLMLLTFLTFLFKKNNKQGGSPMKIPTRKLNHGRNKPILFLHLMNRKVHLAFWIQFSLLSMRRITFLVVFWKTFTILNGEIKKSFFSGDQFRVKVSFVNEEFTVEKVLLSIQNCCCVLKEKGATVVTFSFKLELLFEKEPTWQIKLRN